MENQYQKVLKNVLNNIKPKMTKSTPHRENQIKTSEENKRVGARTNSGPSQWKFECVEDGEDGDDSEDGEDVEDGDDCERGQQEVAVETKILLHFESI